MTSEEAKKAHPILMSAPMVRAILEDRKSQTRRTFKNAAQDAHTFCICVDGTWIAWCGAKKIGTQKDYDDATAKNYPNGGGIKCPYGKVGDRLWCKETFLYRGNGESIIYRADLDPVEAAGVGKMYGGWKPSIFMRRSLSRITLEIIRVRVERLHDISEADSKAEGTEMGYLPHQIGVPPIAVGYVPMYRRLWESISGAGSWAINPWVFALDFKRVKQ